MHHRRATEGGCLRTALQNPACRRDIRLSHERRDLHDGHAARIGPCTVDVYRANVTTKMQACNLFEIVRFAIRAGILKELSDINSA